MPTAPSRRPAAPASRMLRSLRSAAPATLALKAPRTPAWWQEASPIAIRTGRRATTAPPSTGATHEFAWDDLRQWPRRGSMSAAPCTYEEGNFPINVAIKDADGTVTVTSSARILDAALTATGGFSIFSLEGAATGSVKVASFTDSDPNGRRATTAPRSSGATARSSAGTITANAQRRVRCQAPTPTTRKSFYRSRSVWRSRMPTASPRATRAAPSSRMLRSLRPAVPASPARRACLACSRSRDSPIAIRTGQRSTSPPPSTGAMA